jgi:excisionase family DNA binding protein
MENDCILLTIKQVSSMTGLKIGSLYHFVSEGRLPVIRISARCIRFRREDIEKWIANKLVQPKG